MGVMSACLGTSYMFGGLRGQKNVLHALVLEI